MLDKLKEYLLKKDDPIIEELISQWEFEMSIGEDTSAKIKVAREVLNEKNGPYLKNISKEEWDDLLELYLSRKKDMLDSSYEDGVIRIVKRFCNSSPEVEDFRDKMENMSYKIYEEIKGNDICCLSNSSYGSGVFGWVNIELQKDTTIDDLKILLKLIEERIYAWY